MKKNTSVDVLQPLFDAFSEKIKLLEERIEALEKRKETPPDTLSSDKFIKVYPENATDKHKEILNKLAEKYLIKPELTQSNKFQPINKHGEKNLIRGLYIIAPDYTHNNAIAFMTMFIETDKEGCIIHNYCRELRKDSPTVKT